MSGTLTPGGRWLELGMTHPRHGRIVLTDAPPYTGAAHDQPAVRAYRAALASRDRVGFGFALPEPSEVALIDDTFPVATHEAAGGRIELVTFAPPGARGAVQILRAEGTSLDVAMTGAPRLARAAYTQLTPGGALPAAVERPRTGTEEGVVWIADDGLGAAAAIATAPGAAEGSLALAVALGATRGEAVAAAAELVRGADALWETTRAARRDLWQRVGEDAVVRRAVAYALDCAASRSSKGDALLADHVILPLVWTRDAYYVCRMLLAADPHGPGGDLVARFLRWCFEAAERPDGWWPRASLASGAAKDPVFQLDQQLYPLLLLEDHARLTRTPALRRRYAPIRDEVIRSLLAKRSDLGLVATAETPADDPIDAPFHFSSHVLLWRVLRDLDPARAGEVRDAALKCFGVDGMYAYAVRGARGDGAVRYHDANDLPTVFAPGWGFCAADDPRWTATVGFAWSEADRGYVGGPLGGLGSVHTLHPWPLGDLQSIIVARLTGDAERERRARERLRRVATWDGMLPEAYDETTGEVASRHWFAWPVALWALLEREPRLVAP